MLVIHESVAYDYTGRKYPDLWCNGKKEVEENTQIYGVMEKKTKTSAHPQPFTSYNIRGNYQSFGDIL
jgi:hypothetical protein